MNDKNDNILLALLEVFRSDPLIFRERIILSLMVLAWWKVSYRNDLVLPENLKINNYHGITSNNLKNIFNEIFKQTKDESFNEENSLIITKLRDISLDVLIKQVLSMGENGYLDQFNPTDVSLLIPRNEITDETILPKEVVDLMLLIAGDMVNKKVYLPWENSGQFTGRVITSNGVPTIESNFYAGYSNLIATIVNDKPIKFLHNDIFLNPGLVEDGKLKTLDMAIAHLIFRGFSSVDKTLHEHDLLGRFTHKSRSFLGLAVSHLVIQIKGRIIITVPEGFLFSGSDRALREYLVKSQQVEAVISMPGGLLSTAAIRFSILVLNTEEASPKVRFVNAGIDDYSTVMSRAQNKLINIIQLHELIKSNYEDDNVRNISTEEILRSESSLNVSHYVSSKEENDLTDMLAGKELVPLHTFADLIGARSLIYASGDIKGIEVAEVGAADLPEFGYIQSASKTSVIDIKNKNIKKLYLRPNDIVFIIKGSTGKVGIISEDAPSDYWLPGRSSVVIRLHDDSKFTAKALFMLLRSELGKEIIKQISLPGSAIPFIQLRQLEGLLIPVSTEAEASRAVKALDEEAAIQKEIFILKKRQAELSLNFWRIN